jgi:hypothetical protein
MGARAASDIAHQVRACLDKQAGWKKGARCRLPNCRGSFWLHFFTAGTERKEIYENMHP